MIVLNGKRIINFVYDICRNNPLLQKVVATCDKLISDISKKIFKIIMTSTKHKIVTRIVEATKKIGKEIRPNDYIIVQGDGFALQIK